MSYLREDTDWMSNLAVVYYHYPENLSRLLLALRVIFNSQVYFERPSENTLQISIEWTFPRLF